MVSITKRHIPDHNKTQGIPGKPSVLVDHYHDKFDYDDSDSVGEGDPPSKTRGEDFWDWYYAGWTLGDAPNPIPGTSADGSTIGGGSQTPTIKQNCFAYTFHGFKGAGAKANFWTDTPNPYMDELKNKCAAGNNCSKFAATPGWVAYSAGHCHAWKLTETKNNNGPATKTTWKNNSSGIYVWNHATNTQTNCGPLGPVPDTTTGETTFGIYSAENP